MDCPDDQLFVGPERYPSQSHAYPYFIRSKVTTHAADGHLIYPSSKVKKPFWTAGDLSREQPQQHSQLVGSTREWIILQNKGIKKIYVFQALSRRSVIIFLNITSTKLHSIREAPPISPRGRASLRSGSSSVWRLQVVI